MQWVQNIKQPVAKAVYHADHIAAVDTAYAVLDLHLMNRKPLSVMLSWYEDCTAHWMGRWKTISRRPQGAMMACLVTCGGHAER